jgi:hypothetical protein
MLKNSGDYNASLETFSKPLMPLVDYELDGPQRHVRADRKASASIRCSTFSCSCSVRQSRTEGCIPGKRNGLGPRKGGDAFCPDRSRPGRDHPQAS